MSDSEEKKQTEEGKKQEDFSFIKEKRKDKPLNKRRMLIQAIYTVLLATVFGLVACVSFVCIKPRIEEIINPKDEQKVVIPSDEEATENPTEKMAEEAGADMDDEAQKTDETETVYIPQMQELEPESYQALVRKLYAIGESVENSIVTVTGIQSDTDWFNAEYNSEDSESGVIVANTGETLLVLTNDDVIAEAESIRVTLQNKTMTEASVVARDQNTGLAVLSVQLSELDEADLESISVATLGNSLGMKRGTVVIAIGRLLGSSMTILPGNIIATDGKFQVADASYSVFETDITGNQDGNGVLINLNGEVVGLISANFGVSSSNLSAVSVSELKSLIEILSNGGQMPYLGLYVSTVTEEMADEYELPTGVYISSVEMDSPAMSAGLFNGDIIQEVGGKVVSTVKEYTDALTTYEGEKPIRIVVERQSSDGYSKVSILVTPKVTQ